MVEARDADSAAALVIDLNRYWLMSGRLVEGRRWIELASTVVGHNLGASARLSLLAGTYASYLNDPGTATTLEAALAQADAIALPVDRLVVNGWCCLAAFAAHHGDLLLADRAAHTAAQLASANGDPGLTALARDIDGYVAAYTGDRKRSLAANISGVADARRAGDTYDVVNLLINAAGDLLHLDRLGEAISFSDEAFDLTVNLDAGHPLLVAVLLIRGSVHVAEERAGAARGSLLEALRLARDRYPDPLVTADILYTLGACASQEHSDREACWSFGAAEALYHEHGLTPEVRLAPRIVRGHHALRERVGEDTFITLKALGTADPDRAIAHLLGRLEVIQPL